MKGIGIEIMKVLVNLIVFYYPYDKALMSWTKQLVEYNVWSTQFMVSLSHQKQLLQK